MKFFLILGLMFSLCACSNKNSPTAAPKPGGPSNNKGNSDPGTDPGAEAGPKPAPSPVVTPAEPDPAEIIGIVATSWSKVKYAFCSAQGAYGVLIDFQGTDLASTKAGHFTMGTRRCNGSLPFKWSDVSEFTSSFKDKTLTLDFGNTMRPPNTIEVYGDLGPYKTFYGVMGGNSGPCVFLENKATGGNLFASEPMFSCK